MSEPHSLQAALRQAGRDFPPPLPRGFADEIVARALAAAPAASSVFRPSFLLPLAAMAVLTALATSLSAGRKEALPAGPPALTVFGGGTGAGSPFVIP